MIYTPRIKAAIRFAIKTHEVYQKQKRKGKDIPYITHPMTVALILSQAKMGEDVVMAGLLHDTIEDSPAKKKVTAAMLRQRFGRRVADLVVSVTEPNKQATWAERKQEAFRHIATFTHGSVALKSADTLANVSDTLDDYKRDGEATFTRFNSNKSQIISNYAAVMAALVKRWPSSSLAGDLKSARLALLRLQ